MPLPEILAVSQQGHVPNQEARPGCAEDYAVPAPLPAQVGWVWTEPQGTKGTPVLWHRTHEGALSLVRGCLSGGPCGQCLSWGGISVLSSSCPG